MSNEKPDLSDLKRRLGIGERVRERLDTEEPSEYVRAAGVTGPPLDEAYDPEELFSWIPDVMLHREDLAAHEQWYKLWALFKVMEVLAPGGGHIFGERSVELKALLAQLFLEREVMLHAINRTIQAFEGGDSEGTAQDPHIARISEAKLQALRDAKAGEGHYGADTARFGQRVKKLRDKRREAGPSKGDR